jgi:hypothetical protein
MYLKTLKGACFGDSGSIEIVRLESHSKNKRKSTAF